MNDIKRKIAALSVISTLLTTVAGCRFDNKLRYEYNEQTKQEELIGKVSIDDAKNFCILEMTNNLNNSNKLYLCSKENVYTGTIRSRHLLAINFTDLKSNIGIATYNENDKNFTSEYGTVKSIETLFDYIMYYDYDIKNEYSADEINELFERIKEDYKSNNEQNVLKKKISE